MKKFFSLILTVVLIFFQYSNVQAGDGVDAHFTWNANSFENVTKLEFILDLKGSMIEYGVSLDKTRLSVKENVNDEYQILSVSNVDKYEEKLVLRLTGESGNYVDFVNFDTRNTTNKFHDIVLINLNGNLKAKVVIYIHEDLNYDVYSTLMKNGELSLKSAKYLYVGEKRGKPYNKARLVKIN